MAANRRSIKPSIETLESRYQLSTLLPVGPQSPAALAGNALILEWNQEHAMLQTSIERVAALQGDIARLTVELTTDRHQAAQAGDGLTHAGSALNAAIIDRDGLQRELGDLRASLQSLTAVRTTHEQVVVRLTQGIQTLTATLITRKRELEQMQNAPVAVNGLATLQQLKFLAEQDKTRLKAEYIAIAADRSLPPGVKNQRLIAKDKDAIVASRKIDDLTKAIASLQAVRPTVAPSPVSQQKIDAKKRDITATQLGIAKSNSDLRSARGAVDTDTVQMSALTTAIGGAVIRLNAANGVVATQTAERERFLQAVASVAVELEKDEAAMTATQHDLVVSNLLMQSAAARAHALDAAVADFLTTPSINMHSLQPRLEVVAIDGPRITMSLRLPPMEIVRLQMGYGREEKMLPMAQGTLDTRVTLELSDYVHHFSDTYEIILSRPGQTMDRMDIRWNAGTRQLEVPDQGRLHSSYVAKILPPQAPPILEYDRNMGQLDFANLSRELADQAVILSGLVPTENAADLVRRGYPQLTPGSSYFNENVKAAGQDMSHALDMITAAAAAAFGNILSVRTGGQKSLDGVSAALFTKNGGVGWVLGMLDMNPERIYRAVERAFDAIYRKAMHLNDAQEQTYAEIRARDLVPRGSGVTETISDAAYLHNLAVILEAHKDDPDGGASFVASYARSAGRELATEQASELASGIVPQLHASPDLNSAPKAEEKIVTASGDVLTPMTRDSLTRIRDNATKAMESANARWNASRQQWDASLVAFFKSQRDAAVGLLGLIPEGATAPVISNDAQVLAWKVLIERTTTDPVTWAPLDLNMLKLIPTRPLLDAVDNRFGEWISDQANSLGWSSLSEAIDLFKQLTTAELKTVWTSLQNGSTIAEAWGRVAGIEQITINRLSSDENLTLSITSIFVGFAADALYDYLTPSQVRYDSETETTLSIVSLIPIGNLIVKLLRPERLGNAEGSPYLGVIKGQPILAPWLVAVSGRLETAVNNHDRDTLLQIMDELKASYLGWLSEGIINQDQLNALNIELNRVFLAFLNQ